MMSAQLQCRAIIAAAIIWCGYGTEISVEVGQDISETIFRAQHGDTIVLKNGKHVIGKPVNIHTQVKIIPETKGFVQLLVPDENSIVFQFGASAAFATTIEDILVQTKNGSECSLAEPYAMLTDFSFELAEARVSNKRLNLISNTGPWYNRRNLVDVRYGNCKYSDIMSKNSMAGGAYKLLGSCNGQFVFNIPIAKLSGSEGCGATVFEHESFTGYEAQIEGRWSETIKNDTPGVALPATVSRVDSELVESRIQIDGIRDIVVSFGEPYIRDDIRVSMDTVDVGYYDDYKHSRIRLEVRMMAPHTVAGGYEGIVIIDNNLTETGSVSGYVVSESCNHLDSGTECVQKLEFDIQTCDMTGFYTLVDLPLECSEASVDGSPIDCPTMNTDQQSLNVTFHMSTKNVCETPNADNRELVNRVASTAGVFADAAFSSKQPSNTVKVGDTSFWAIKVTAQSSDLNIYNAEVVAVERTSDGACKLYEEYLGNLGSYQADQRPNQAFDPSTQEVHIQLPVTANMACTTHNSTRNSVTIKFTVSVDYDDIVADRRRTPNRRDTGLIEVFATVGVVQTGDQHLALLATSTIVDSATPDTTRVDESKSSSGVNAGLVVLSVGLIMLMCCCLCCGLIGYVVMKRRIKKRRKSEHSSEKKVLAEDLSSLSIGSTIAGVTPRRPRAKSNMGLQRPGSVMESSLQAGNRNSMIVSPRFRRCSSILITTESV